MLAGFVSVLHRKPIRLGLTEVQTIDLLVSVMSILEEVENAIGTVDGRTEKCVR